jgi:hypothetical protein
MNSTRWSEWLDLVTHPSVVLAVIGVVAGAIISVGVTQAWLMTACKVAVVAVPGLLGLKAAQGQGQGQSASGANVATPATLPTDKP